MASTAVAAACVRVVEALPLGVKVAHESKDDVERETPAQAQAQVDTDDESVCSEAESTTSCSCCDGTPAESTTSCSCCDGTPAESQPKQLEAGLFEEDLVGSTSGPPHHVQETPGAPVAPVTPPMAQAVAPCNDALAEKFEVAETLFIFDWDDTILPSSWVRRQGLRLDAASVVSAAQHEVLAEVSAAACQILQAARQHGTVVLVTNAERGWIELSCQKFLPTLAPMLENVRMVSARTTFEGPECQSPLDWKLRAFEVEIQRYFGDHVLLDEAQRKNIFSIGDSVHEREALLRATAALPNCRSKSLKFVDRPDYSQICKQHELISSCFDQIVHHDENLDMCIRCP